MTYPCDDPVRNNPQSAYVQKTIMSPRETQILIHKINSVLSYYLAHTNNHGLFNQPANSAASQQYVLITSQPPAQQPTAVPSQNQQNTAAPNGNSFSPVFIAPSSTNPAILNSTKSPTNPGFSSVPLKNSAAQFIPTPSALHSPNLNLSNTQTLQASNTQNPDKTSNALPNQASANSPSINSGAVHSAIFNPHEQVPQTGSVAPNTSSSASSPPNPSTAQKNSLTSSIAPAVTLTVKSNIPAQEATVTASNVAKPNSDASAPDVTSRAPTAQQKGAFNTQSSGSNESLSSSSIPSSNILKNQGVFGFSHPTSGATPGTSQGTSGTPTFSNSGSAISETFTSTPRILGNQNTPGNSAPLSTTTQGVQGSPTLGIRTPSTADPATMTQGAALSSITTRPGVFQAPNSISGSASSNPSTNIVGTTPSPTPPVRHTDPVPLVLPTSSTPLASTNQLESKTPTTDSSKENIAGEEDEDETEEEGDDYDDEEETLTEP
jgi:hypothetical protein